MELNLKFVAKLLVFLIIVFAVFAIVNGKANPKTGAVVYKSLTCGCCEGFISELEKDFDVEIKIMDDISSIKDKYDIPSEMQSCHTTIIGDYFIEGHVPMEAINKLLETMPDIAGIILPGMPAGAPGMSGTKKEPFKIYSLKDGVTSEFLEI